MQKQKEEEQKTKAKKTEDDEEARKLQLARERQDAAKKSLKGKEKKLQKEECEAQKSWLAGQAILHEANSKFISAVKTKDMKQVTVAQMMLEQGGRKSQK